MNWSERLRWREKVHERYPDLWDLRLARKRLPLSLKYLKDGEKVLEIGASNRDLEKRIKGRLPRAVYKSLDVDRTYPHDYSSFDEIREPFDLVLLFEVIEHLSLEEGIEMVGRIYQILNPGGRVVLSTPNVYTPGQYWKDASHLVPYHYEEVGGLFLSQGFEIVDMRRMFRKSLAGFILKGYLLSPLFRFLGIDFSESILLVARKSVER
jgi:SAM-dependent methyltransferase